jgi:hypothetical protein
MSGILEIGMGGDLSWPRCFVFIVNFILTTWQASVGGVSGVCQIACTVMMHGG